MTEPYEIDLHWVAFQYLTDELSSADAKAFERQLAEDQNARAALAQTVELCEAALALPADVVRSLPYAQPSHVATVAPLAKAPYSTSGHPGWLRPAGWLAMGAAVCLALVMSVQMLSSDGVGLFGSGPKQSSAQLALAWTQTQAELSPELRAWFDQVWSSVDEAESHRTENLVSNDDGSLTTPSWLLAAVEQKPPARDDDEAAEK